ncbi:MAG TPA: hypothetical protein VFG45_06080 [Candidatus Nitrosocosmicus sp.]|nr:hypothetical protein [Candidatus Nitrosocosmicus sp.]
MTGRCIDNPCDGFNDVKTSNSAELGMPINEHESYPKGAPIESEITRFIRSSVERSQKYEPDQTTSTIKQVIDISNDAFSEIPILINYADHFIKKAISLGKEGIQTITELKNSFSMTKRD